MFAPPPPFVNMEHLYIKKISMLHMNQPKAIFFVKVFFDIYDFNAY
jgi:hypothetical protein